MTARLVVISDQSSIEPWLRPVLATVAAALLLAWLAWVWVALPLLERRRRSSSGGAR